MILITGGGGYIGSHVNKILHAKGYETLVLDNLVHGHREAVRWGIFSEGDIGDRAHTSKLFQTYPIRAIMHFSGFLNVGESVEDPQKYYMNNVGGTLKLLEAYMEQAKNKPKNFIFSSTCATYGIPTVIPIREDSPQNPINPYGRSKLIVEKILKDYQKAYGLSYSILRYFNAAGADPDGEIGERHEPETHLIPLTLEAALGKRDSVQIYGNDHPTKDGTCIRDYIHVNDLAEAHILALENILDQNKASVYNLGTGSGYSVREIIQAAQKITGAHFRVQEVKRREGDPPELIADPQKIMKELNWSPALSDIDTIIRTAWNWHKIKK